jgi:hypothetical protein
MSAYPEQSYKHLNHAKKNKKNKTDQHEVTKLGIHQNR